MNAQLTIVIPIFNEAESLGRLEIALIDYLKKVRTSTKILLINDGSTDDSEQLIETICETHSDFSFLSFTKNFGLSAALKAGFDHADTALIGYMDADLQTDPEDFNVLLPYADSFDLVTGVRVNRKDRLIKRLSSKFANRFRRLFTKDNVSDTGCPLKIIRSDVAKRIPMFKGLHRFLPAMVLLQEGTVKEVPVKHFPRSTGRSKFGLSNRVFGPLVDCFAYLWMKHKYIHYQLKEKDK